jgi:UDP-N-acetylmuramoyl-tripeptide--D-alanyl-D-alanine ligase
MAPGEWFLALRGENFDGHDFVGKLAASGTPGAIVAAEFEDRGLPGGFGLIRVDDPLTGYQRLASAYRATLPLRVIAITGSSGKTSTKDLTAAVLGQRFRVLKTEGNLNNHIGVPRTLLRAGPEDEIGVIEMGMNHPGELEPLARMAQPEAAIITNIGEAHLEFMGTRAAIAQEKGMVAEAVGPEGCVILSAEDEFSESIARRTRARVVLAGFGAGAVRAEDFRQEFTGCHFTLVADGFGKTPAFLPVLGKHMVQNALLAIAAGLKFGLSPAECVAGLAQARLTKGRLEPKTVRGLHVLDDTYNANPDSMFAALQTLASIPVSGARVAVLGKMGELGAAAEDGHLRVGAAAARAGVDRLITVGAEAELIAQGARTGGLREVFAAEDLPAAAAWLSQFARPEDLILLKGSRSAGLERLLPMLTPLAQ